MKNVNRLVKTFVIANFRDFSHSHLCKEAISLYMTKILRSKNGATTLKQSLFLDCTTINGCLVTSIIPKAICIEFKKFLLE